jgi:hypothetical protein
MADELFEADQESAQSVSQTEAAVIASTEAGKELSAPITLVAKVQDVKTGAVSKALADLKITDASLTALRNEVDEALKGYDGSKGQYEALGKLRNRIIRNNKTPTKDALKAAREESLNFQKLVVAAENILVEFYDDQAGRIKQQELMYEAEVARVAEEKAKVERERVEGLFGQLKAFEWPGNALIVAQMTDEQFKEALETSRGHFEEVQAARKAEAERKAQADKDAAELAETNRKEAERLAQVEAGLKAEQARIDAENKATQERLAAEQKTADERNAAALREIEEKKAAGLKEVEDAKAAALEQQRLDKEASDKIERDRSAAEAQARADEDAKVRAAMLAPDRDKIVEYCRTCGEALSHVPTLTDKGLQDDLDHMVETIRGILDHRRISMGGN